MKKIVILSVYFLSFVQIFLGQNTIFVSTSATGLHNGSSWLNAYNSISAAVSSASTGDTILIKSGVYKESFSIDKSIRLIGGFEGTELYAFQSNPAANEVVLSGDILDDDIPGTVLYRGDNLKTLISVQNISEGDIFIAGISFKGAHNNGNYNFNRGSAIIIINGTNGDLNNIKEIHVDIKRCKFEENYSYNDGGAIYSGSTLTGNKVFTRIDKCSFRNNRTSFSRGGAIYNYAYGGNQAYAGLVVTNCVFENNLDSSNEFPSVIYNSSSSNPGVAACEIVNNTFNNNTGGAVFCYHGYNNPGTYTSLLFRNNIISNQSTSYAPIYIGTLATANNSYQVTIDRNCFQTAMVNNASNGVSISNTIESDPLFFGTSDFRLQENSPCVNAGDTSNISLTYIDTLDFQDSSRFQGIVDLGAYEYQFPAEEPEDTTNSASILSMHLNLDIEMYPNPANDQIHVKLPQQEKVQIYDLQGNLLMTSEPALTHTINIQKLASGVYIMKSVNSSLRFIKTN
jgi:trimeric autotransporter adhesin